ncbi:ABC transporter permease subunit [Oceanobacillus sp. FSL W8-0428]|uniref:PhnE/PtxC family ABC transporter permease n=1 Tax=Oceanobacillus TaxID=182709 RepID=UPI0030FA4840
MEMNYIRVTSKGSIWKMILLVAALVSIFVLAAMLINLNLEQFFARLENVPGVLNSMMAIDASIIPAALLELVTSLSLAFLALVVGVFLAIILSFLAASNITPNNFLSSFIKGSFAVIRSIPSLVWGLMVIASLGFGNTSGFIAMLFSAIGYLVKMFTGSIEDAGYDVIEAMRSTGASWFNIVYHGLLPLCITSFVAWITVRFEGNISESISLGIIGVGGIGLLLTQAIGTYNYAQTTTIVIIICSFMLIIEFLMTRIKSKITHGSR